MAKFEYEYYGQRRVGRIILNNGVIETPGFICCATYGTLKGADIKDYTGDIVLVNALHCYEYIEPIKQSGGVSKFMGWDRPVISDSGGFQIFSLSGKSVSSEIKGVKQSNKKFVKVHDDYFQFTNPRTGKKHNFGYKESMQTQIDMKVDIAIVFDECASASLSKEEMRQSMERSHRWERKSLKYFHEHKHPHQSIYTIVHGGTYPDLRAESVQFVNSQDCFGVAIGGSLGKSPDEMRKTILETAKQIDPLKPVHVLGIGFLYDIFLTAGKNCDTFDCVHPTRIARHGVAIVPGGNINIKNSKYKFDLKPLDKDCKCSTCKNHSRSYIHHMFKCKSIPGITAMTIHNMFTMHRFMRELRYSIKDNTLGEFESYWFSKSSIS